MKTKEDNLIWWKILLVMSVLTYVMIAVVALARAQGASPTPTPGTAEEYWYWFDAHKLKVAKSDQTSASQAQVRPLVTEPTLSDPEQLPKGIWGARRYRKYIEELRGGAVVGLWHRGEHYEVLWTAASAGIVIPAVYSWEDTISKIRKYNPKVQPSPVPGPPP